MILQKVLDQLLLVCGSFLGHPAMAGMMLDLHLKIHVRSYFNAFQFLAAAVILVKLVVKYGACSTLIPQILAKPLQYGSHCFRSCGFLS